MTRPPTHIIGPAQGTRTVMYQDGDTRDIMRTVMYADARSADYVLPGALNNLRGATPYATCRNIFNFIRKNVQYRPDRPGHEIVRSPGYLLSSGTGDCKSYSIAIMALCRAFGIPATYRFVAYRPGDFTHVYIVATMADGRPVILDAVHGVFDDEVKYRRSKDVRSGERIAGLAGIFDNGTFILLMLVAAWLWFAEPVSIKIKKNKKKKKSDK